MKLVLFGTAPNGLVDELTAPLADTTDAVDVEVRQLPDPIGMLSKQDLEAAAEAAYVFVVVEVGCEPAAFELVRRLTSDGIPVGAVTAVATREFLSLALAAGATPLIEVSAKDSPGWEATRRGIAAARTRVATRGTSASSDAIEFGQILPLPADQSSYERSRSLSLVSASMQEFLEDLGDAVRDLQRHVRSQQSAAAVSREPGWREGTPGYWAPQREPVNGPDGTPRKRQVVPTLEDLFTWSDHPEARAILQSDEKGLSLAARIGAPASVLIRGESGSGKSLVANLIRDILDGGAAPAGAQWRPPRVDVNCAGMTAHNFDHEMFGSGPGRWTGIDKAVVGALARASRGTVFLDEIGDMSWDGQGRLLKFLDDGLIRPEFVDPFPSYSQIIAATNRNLESLIRQRLFKHDLLARFRVQVTIPPLRDREPAERQRLIDFVAQNPLYNPQVGDHRAVRAISREALNHLTAAKFEHGNFRELEVTVHEALRRARRRKSEVLDVSDLPDPGLPFLDEEAARFVQASGPVRVGDVIVHMATLHDLERLAMHVGAPLIREPDGDVVVVQPGVLYRFLAPGGQG